MYSSLILIIGRVDDDDDDEEEDEEFTLIKIYLYILNKNNKISSL